MQKDSTQPKKHLKLDSILRTSAIVLFFLVTAKLLNFFKKILIGQLFGVSSVADAFFAASYLPYYLALFFEGVLFLGFLPLFSQVMLEKGEKEAREFVTEVSVAILLLTGLLVILGWQMAPWIIHQLVPGFSASEQELTRTLFQIHTLIVIFISLTSFFKALNSYFGHYALAASSALVDTLVTIAVTLMAWKLFGIYGAAWAAVAGAFSALLFQGFFLYRKHAIFAPRFSLKNEWIGKLILFLIPMGAIWGFQQIPLILLNRFGSGMWEGTISALSISQTLTTVPMGLVNHTVLFAVFPALAKQAHESSLENLKETFFKTLRGGFLILVPLGFLLTSLAKPVAALFFSGGGISLEGTSRISNSLACFGWATFALYADVFMTQSLIAIRKPLPAIFLCGTRAVLTYVSGYILSTYWDYKGLAFSFSLAMILNFFLLFPIFFRMSPFQGKWKNLFTHTAKLILAASPIFLIITFVNHWSIKVWIDFPVLLKIAVLAAGGLAGLGVYLVFLSFFKIDEAISVGREIKKTLAKKVWWLAEQTN